MSAPEAATTVPCRECELAASQTGPSGPFHGRQYVGIFTMEQPAGLGIVIEDLGVASPVQRRLELPLDFIRAEVLVEDVAEKLLTDGVIALGVQGVLDQPQYGNVLQRGFAKHGFLGLNIGLGKAAALRRDLDIALTQHGKTQQLRRFD